MLFSAIAVIHFFVLEGTFRWGFAASENLGPGPGDIAPWDSFPAKNGGDVDFWGILPVLLVTGVMLAPILAWSSTFRNCLDLPTVEIPSVLPCVYPLHEHHCSSLLCTHHLSSIARVVRKKGRSNRNPINIPRNLRSLRRRHRLHSKQEIGRCARYQFGRLFAISTCDAEYI